jgi:hypothetical protein
LTPNRLMPDGSDVRVGPTDCPRLGETH